MQCDDFATILGLKFAKLRLNFRILSQNCDWIFSLISSPVTLECFEGTSVIEARKEGCVTYRDFGNLDMHDQLRKRLH